MKTIKTDKDKLTVQELRDKRDKISSDLKKLNPEELKKYIAERLNQEKQIPEEK
jgi:tripartite-type tricarboxylate transporter receptor subunit TctC